MKLLGIFQAPTLGESKRNSLLVSLALVGLVLIIPVALIFRYDSPREQFALAFEASIGIVIIAMVRRQLRLRQVELPWPVAVLFAADIWANTLANILDFYSRFSFWDNIAHTVGSAVATVGILMILKILQKRGRLQLGSLFVAMVALSMALALSVVYELTEYAGDLWFDTHRITSLYDTSSDLFYNALGAVAVLLLAHPRSMLHRITNDRLPVLDRDLPY